VFEIGASLREARLHRKLELAEVERDTHIRAKYLMALEDDRFDALPGTAYAKGFLRTYADYLGLDGSRFIDEYNGRFAPEEELPAGAPVRSRRRRSASGRKLLLLPLTAAAIGLAAWQLSSSGNERGGAIQPSSPLTTRMKPPTTTRHAPPAVTGTPRRARVARFVIVASRGPCWLDVRQGSAHGTPLFMRTLQQTERARFAAQRLWIRFGAPWNADATLNGSRVRLPAAIADVVVSASGLSVVS